LPFDPTWGPMANVFQERKITLGEIAKEGSRNKYITYLGIGTVTGTNGSID